MKHRMNAFAPVDTANTKVCKLAKNLTHNCCYAGVPCSADKPPTRMNAEAGERHTDAAADAGIIQLLGED